jgi:hypothetical protein
VEIGYRPGPAEAAPAGLGWSSRHGGDRIQTDEAVMITGDGNLVELQATVRYSVQRDQVHTYLFEVGDADAILRSATEAVLREVVAGRAFLELLTIPRDQFQRDVLARLDRRCAAYGEHGLGIRLEGLTLHDLHPPQEVVEAYHDVAKAMERHDQRINTAQAEALKTRRQAEAKALQTVRTAEAEANRKVQMAAAGRDGYLALQRVRSQLSLPEEWDLLRTAFTGILGGQEPRAAFQEYQQQRQEKIAMQRFLIDFRLSWQTLTSVLKDRDKILIDTDQMPGRRHLLLFNPEPFQIPAVTGMPERGPARRRDSGHEEGP